MKRSLKNDQRASEMDSICGFPAVSGDQLQADIGRSTGTEPARSPVPDIALRSFEFRGSQGGNEPEARSASITPHDVKACGLPSVSPLIDIDPSFPDQFIMGQGGEIVEAHGLGEAINDRLRRAAGFVG